MNAYSSLPGTAMHDGVGSFLDLKDKVVLVTGAASGLGAACARLFGEMGCHVICADVSQQLEAYVDDLRVAGLRVTECRLDVCQPEQWARARHLVAETFGQLHVLVNNAGIIVRTGIADTSLEAWRRVLDVNVTGAFLGIQTMAPLMPDSAGAAIVNVSSTAGLIAHKDVSYTTSKWALRGLTKSASLDLVARGIRVNSVHPATISTALTDAAPPGHVEANRHAIPMGREASAREIAQIVVFLASSQSSFMTGAEIAADGGLTSSGVPWMRAAYQRTVAI